MLLGCPFVTDEYASSIRDRDGDGFDAISFGGADCDDDDPAIHPGATEDWNDADDEDCDGNLDDQDLDGVPFSEDCDDDDAAVGATRAWFDDLDGDGFGGAQVDGDCEASGSQISQGGDCDDTRPDVNPSAPERCDPFDVDEDCDGLADDLDVDGAAPLDPFDWYSDDDRDGFGAGDPLPACDPAEGWSLEGGDCNDTEPLSYPGAVWFVDRDNDGWGDPETAIPSCEAIAGRINVGEDCDDTDPERHPGAADPPFDLVDADCAGDTDFDGDGDGLPDPMPTWDVSWPDAWPCAPTLTERHVGVGHPYATIQEAIDDAVSCDTVVVHDGTYDDFTVAADLDGGNDRVGLVVAAAPGATPVVRGSKGLEATATIATVGVLLSGLTLEEAPYGVYTVGVTVLDRVDVQDTTFAVESGDLLFAMGSRFERATFGVRSQGVTVLTDVDFVDIVGVGGVLDVDVPRRGDVENYDVLLNEVRFERCTGGLLPIAQISGQDVVLNQLSWEDPGSPAILLQTESLFAQGLTIEQGVSYGDHIIQVTALEAESPLDPRPVSTALVQDVFVRGHLWVPGVAPAFLAMDEVEHVTLRNVVLRGNILYPGKSNLLVPPVWVRALNTANGAQLTRTLHNIEVSAADEFQTGETGIGIMTQAGSLSQITVVGLDVALWPVIGRNQGSGILDLSAPTVTDAIAWNVESLYYREDAIGVPFGEPQTERVVSNTSCDDCETEDPRFLRFDPNMPALSWDLRLRRDSPYYRWEQPEDTTPTCSDERAVAFQLGAYGYHAGYDEPQTAYYDDCDSDGMYDTWEWELLALSPDLDDDGDGLTNLEEFELGTYPHLADSDSDTVPDDIDGAPFDPTQ